MKAVIYVHGMGGNPEESQRYVTLFPDCDVIGLEYSIDVPWESGREIYEKVSKLKGKYESIILIANSIGAFLSMYSGIDSLVEKAFFISPIVDMESLILGMMAMDGVTEDELKSRGRIITPSGNDLSWEYLSFVRDNPVRWNAETYVLYGSLDNMTSRSSIERFAREKCAGLTVLYGGEHWFHTDRQMEYLDSWLKGEKPVKKSFLEEDLGKLHSFLIELNSGDEKHINWNWARFEWMYGHPEFDNTLIDRICIWYMGNKPVGAVIYDMYPGEAFCGVLNGYEDIYQDMLRYAFSELSDENGIGIAFPDTDQEAVSEAMKAGFRAEGNGETVLKIDLAGLDKAGLPDGYSFTDVDMYGEDTRGLQWLFWQGFDHGDDTGEFERDYSRMLKRTIYKRPHFDPRFSIGVRDRDGVLKSYCCVWYDRNTDYAYVEPVCTVPSERGKGLARAAVAKALERVREAGARKAYVISDLPFYINMGFGKYMHYTFFRRKN
ncbi:MAG: GNAT family N-acetyltransferase [Clostridia bacterium]|nr:GNAT family N-acetyltransferase [Clostridia bacterium]